MSPVHVLHEQLEAKTWTRPAWHTMPRGEANATFPGKYFSKQDVKVENLCRLPSISCKIWRCIITLYYKSWLFASALQDKTINNRFLHTLGYILHLFLFQSWVLILFLFCFFERVFFYVLVWVGVVFNCSFYVCEAVALTRIALKKEIAASQHGWPG